MPDVPIGSIFAWPGPPQSVPRNYLICDGSLLDRVRQPQYQRLFDVIGTTWGGDGVNGFHLPDLRGMFLRGVTGESPNDPDAQHRHASQPQAGNAGNAGNKVGSLQTDAFQGHRHDVRVDRNDIDGSNRTHDVEEGRDKWNADPNLGSINVRVLGPIADDHGEPRIAAETRPKNAYVHWIICFQ